MGAGRAEEVFEKSGWFANRVMIESLEQKQKPRQMPGPLFVWPSGHPDQLAEFGLL
jgi:hypothetical protein